MADSSNMDRSLSRSIGMGVLTIGAGLTWKWLTKKDNRKKLYDTLENLLSSEDSSKKSNTPENLVAATRNKVQGWFQEKPDSDGNKKNKAVMDDSANKETKKGKK